MHLQSRSAKLCLSLAVATVLIAPHLTFAALTDAARLRKLSLNLRGDVPSQEEFEEVNHLKDHGESAEAYFARKTQEYLRSPQFGTKMGYRVYDDLRLGIDPYVNSIFPETTQTIATIEEKRAQNYNRLLSMMTSTTGIKGLVSRHVLSSRPSWNALLAAKDYSDYYYRTSPVSTLYNNLVTILGEMEVLERELKLDRRTAAEIVFGERPVPELTPLKNAKANLRSAAQILTMVYDPALGTLFASTVNESPIAAALLVQRSFDQAVSRNKLSEDTRTKVNAFLFSARADLNKSREFKVFRLSDGTYDGNVDLALRTLDFFSNGQTIDQAKALAVEILDQHDHKPVGSILKSLFYNSEFKNRFNQTRFSTSAAFYRIYMCDEMRPVALGTSSIKEDVLGKINRAALLNGHASAPMSKAGQSGQQTTSPLASDTADEDAPHEQGVCLMCHRKLTNTQAMLDGKKQEIQLVYDDEEGHEHRIPVSSPDQLLPVAQQQEAYVACQTNKFWKWIIGEDVTPSKQRLNQLRRLYKESDGDIAKIVTFLTSIPEFYDERFVLNPSTISSVKPILNRCNGCHMQMAMPSFTELPVGATRISPEKDQRQHVEWLQKIAKNTALTHMGKGAIMPPRSSNWSLTDRDFMKLGRWLADGARDESGHPTIDKRTVDELFAEGDAEFVKSVREVSNEPTFYFTWRRYLEHTDIGNVMDNAIPNGKTCIQYETNGAVLGIKDRFSGEPVSKQPTVGYLSFINSCFGSRTWNWPGYGNKGNPDSDWIIKRYNLAEIYAIAGPPIKDSNVEVFYDDRWLSEHRWSRLQFEQKQAIVRKLAESLIGPGVLPADELNQIVAEEVEIANQTVGENGFDRGIRSIIKSLMGRDEFLSF